MEPNQNTNNQNSQNESTTKKRLLLNIPTAIIIGAIIIALSIFISNKSKSGGEENQATSAETGQVVQTDIAIDPIAEDEHILGSSKAPVKIFEYSDLECPYCRLFHPSLHLIFNNYNNNNQNKVAWIYRHFPLYKPDTNGQILHSKAGKEAEATECAAELGGNAAFWSFVDGVYKTTKSNNTLDPAKLPEIASNIGLKVKSFNICLASGKYADKIDKSYKAAVAAGAEGTPYVVISSDKKITSLIANKILGDIAKIFARISPNAVLPDGFIKFAPDGSKLSFSGAIDYQALKAIIDDLQ